MDRQPNPPRSLRWQMVRTLIFQWFLPILIILGCIGWYFSQSLIQQEMDNLGDQLSINVNMAADRLDSAITASRVASFDSTIKDAWRQYQRHGGWSTLYQTTTRFLSTQYQDDVRFSFAAFSFAKSPEMMRTSVYNQSLGIGPSAVANFWVDDVFETTRVAGELETGLSFVKTPNQFYLVRNVLASDFQVIGTLVLALNPDYYFGNLALLPWSTQIFASVDQAQLSILGTDPQEGGIPPQAFLVHTAQGREYNLSTTVVMDTHAMEAQFYGFYWIFLVFLLLLIPLLLYVLHFFGQNVTQPMEALMEGAEQIEAGALGHQLPPYHRSREFQYLTDSFNHMSGQLEQQFQRLYQEELALRDAKIKALESHINPHFLNNTLEIINWEARMNGDIKVSKMIESLSTLMDAAVARDKRKTIALAEEMGYISAYLYIIDQRFGKRLSVSQDIADETLTYQVPRLILQPLVENAVEHGIGPGGQGAISIRSYLRHGLLIIDVENDGTLTPEAQAHIGRLLAPGYDTAREPQRNIGIANVNQRLRILYGGPSGLEIGFSHGKVVSRITIAVKE